MQITNVTRITGELNKKFQKIHFRYRKLPFVICLNFFGVIIIALIFLLDLDKLLDFQDLGFIAIGIVAMLNILFFVTLIVSSRKVNKVLDQDIGTNFYDFCDSAIKIKTQSKNVSGDSIFSYDVIASVLVSQRFIALFLNKTEAFIVDANGYSSGSAEELMNLLYQNVNSKKIKVCKWKNKQHISSQSTQY